MSHVLSLTIVFQVKTFLEINFLVFVIQQMNVKLAFAALLYLLMEQELINVATLSIISCIEVQDIIFNV
jgi:hypothetical protein